MAGLASAITLQASPSPGALKGYAADSNVKSLDTAYGQLRSAPECAGLRSGWCFEDLSLKSVPLGRDGARPRRNQRYQCRAQLVQNTQSSSALGLGTSLEASVGRLEETLRTGESVGTGSQDGKPRPLKLLIAGGGIGGLVLALAAKKKGIDVRVFERDLTSIRGEGQYRGPIQLQSNALAALEAVDQEVAEEIMANGCVTGHRINGLVDGLTGEWYIKFDTFTPAVSRGLPITRVISRMTLQDILVRAVGPDIIQNSSNVVDFEDDGSKVTVVLEDGQRFEGDLLVGADGIRSKVRTKLIGQRDSVYADYTCYTGICDYVPADIESVGYRVFLGHKQYFVSSDVGRGMMQWYAFYNEPAGGTDPPHARKKRLLELFGHWCDGVVDLINATPEENILRRDIYDRIPMIQWSKGRVTLLGDSAHAMQPNLGQGGCMAIEDGYQLALDLEKAFAASSQDKLVDIPDVLKRYESERVIRVGAIHGLARMAAIMASTYKPYLGEGLGPLSFLKKLRIPHPGRVGGKFFISIGMPLMLSWVLTGNNRALLEGRAPSCRLEDKADDRLKDWLSDDDALERAICAEWYLVPSGERLPLDSDVTPSGKKLYRICPTEDKPSIVGSVPCDLEEGDPVVIKAPQVAERHARISQAEGVLFLTDLGSGSRTWITSIDGGRYQVPPHMAVRLHPSDMIEFGQHKEAAYKVRARKPLSEVKLSKEEASAQAARLVG